MAKNKGKYFTKISKKAIMTYRNLVIMNLLGGIMFRTILAYFLLAQLLFSQNFHTSDFNPSEKTNHIVEQFLEYARYYHFEGKLEEAINILDKGVDFLDELEADVEDTVRLLAYKGRIQTVKSFITNKDYNSSVETLISAEKMLKDVEDKLIVSDVFNNMGFALYARKYNTDEGSYEEALDYLEKGLKIRSDIEDKQRLAESFIYAGIVYERLEKPQTARKYYQRADSISSLNGYKLEESYAKRHLAFIFLADSELNKSLDYFTQSLRLREEIGYKVYLPFSYLTVGMVQGAKENYKDALSSFQRAESAAQEIGAKRVTVLIYINMGEVLTRMSNISEAKKKLLEAKSISEEIGYNRGIQLAEKYLAELN